MLIMSIVLIIFIEINVDGGIFVSVVPVLVGQNGRDCCESKISTV